jgi:hypothetical protein
MSVAEGILATLRLLVARRPRSRKAGAREYAVLLSTVRPFPGVDFPRTFRRGVAHTAGRL